MPNKDGYQTCKEIRKWEKKNKYPYLPIIALSANVLGDVYTKCVEAGFNSYVTKPVDFKELSTVMLTFLAGSDDNDPPLRGDVMVPSIRHASRRAIPAVWAGSPSRTGPDIASMSGPVAVRGRIG